MSDSVEPTSTDAGDFNPFDPAAFADWQVRAEATLRGRSIEDALTTLTRDGVELHPVLTAARADTHITTSRDGAPWRVIARVDDPDAVRAAEQATADLEGGADTLSLVFPAHTMANGFGITASDRAGLDAALAGVALPLIQTRIEPTYDAAIDAALFQSVVEARGDAIADIDAVLGFDPVGTLLVLGAVPSDWSEQAGRMATDAQALRDAGFAGPLIQADARIVHAAGGTAVQELAYAVAAGICYLRVLETAGWSLDDADSAVSFSLAADTDQLTTIAKFRALRRLWDRVRAASGMATATPIHLHAQTSWRDLTVPDAAVNMLRNTVAAFSAGIGGAVSVDVLPHTLAAGLPEAAARRIARNTQMVLLEEANVWRVQDPAAGSGTIADLTNQLAAAAWKQLQQIEADGGLVATLREGAFQRDVASARADLMGQVARSAAPLVGTNVYATPDLAQPPVAATERQRYARNPGLADPAERPAYADLVRHFANGGARSEATAPPQLDVAGALAPVRLAEVFEELRARVSKARASEPDRPLVALISLGPLATTTRSANAAANLLAAAAIPTTTRQIDPPTSAAAGAAFAETKTTIACICADSASLDDLGHATIEALRGAGANFVMLGAPTNDTATRDLADLVFGSDEDHAVVLKTVVEHIEQQP